MSVPVKGYSASDSDKPPKYWLVQDSWHSFYWVSADLQCDFMICQWHASACLPIRAVVVTAWRVRALVMWRQGSVCHTLYGTVAVRSGQCGLRWRCLRAAKSCQAAVFAATVHAVQSTCFPASHVNSWLGDFSHAVLLTIYTGSQNLLALRTLSSEFCRHAFSYSIWNKLPLSIRSVNSFNSMNSLLKTHLFAHH